MPPNPPCSRQLSQSCLLLSATFHNLRLLEAKKFCVTVTQVAACFPHKPVEPPVTAGQTVQQQPRSTAVTEAAVGRKTGFECCCCWWWCWCTLCTLCCAADTAAAAAVERPALPGEPQESSASDSREECEASHQHAGNTRSRACCSSRLCRVSCGSRASVSSRATCSNTRSRG